MDNAFSTGLIYGEAQNNLINLVPFKPFFFFAKWAIASLGIGLA